MSEKATPMSWKTKPMPEQAAGLDYQAQFSAQEFDQISAGLIPQEMEDKWFIVLDGNTLYLYRSWSGNCIYQVEFAQEDFHYHVSQAIVNRDPGQYLETDKGYDALLLNFLIRHLLLGQDVTFPMPAKTPQELPKGALQHHVSGTACQENKPNSPKSLMTPQQKGNIHVTVNISLWIISELLIGYTLWTILSPWWLWLVMFFPLFWIWAHISHRLIPRITGPIIERALK
jgi:hypothetical protein